LAAAAPQRPTAPSPTIARFDQVGVGDILDANVARPVHECGAHLPVPFRL
jgi:hypothetical protein